jgi:hypothetical protein
MEFCRSAAVSPHLCDSVMALKRRYAPYSHFFAFTAVNGSALDVYWKEPPSSNDSITRCPNVLLTAHIAGVTDYSYQGIAPQVACNILRVFKGHLPFHCVNPEANPSFTSGIS